MPQTLDMRRNRIPGDPKRIHLIAVCGTGMGGLACTLKDMGFEITGSDQKAYPPMSDFLRRKGITVLSGFDGKNISYGPDLVIVGNAVTKDNPEVSEMFRMGLSFCSMPQAVSRFMVSGRKPVVVTGTHGKTTTSSIISWILHESNLDPSFFIGGILRDFDSSYRYGAGEYIVIEGDEYDTAFFDKGPKFSHYDPHIAVLTSIEFDHADIFADIDHVKSTFGGFISGISRQSTLLACDRDENIVELVKESRCSVSYYGTGQESEWRLGRISIDPPWTVFETTKGGMAFGSFRTRLMGEHNLLNALSAVAVADTLMIPKEGVAKALASYQGVKRRQEVRGQKRGITVMDDFAHHPTAVRETIGAVKPYYPDGRIVAVFEPRTNSSMRSVFQTVYPGSFQQADLICIREPSLLSKIPPDERFSAEKLVQDLKRSGRDAHYFPDTDTIIDFLVESAMPRDLILVMSNGGFDNIHERLLAAL